jgi:catechol-2,3-dioxygenase
MKLRVARHTLNLKPLIVFYTDIIGLTVLGEFKDHAGYDGVFIGDDSWHWHLEFTTSATEPQHQPDDDDLLVFHVDSKEKYDAIIERATIKKTPKADPKNPYWIDNGITLIDPEGFRVVISIAQDH